ncbi:MAG: type II secretion system protein [Alphaproteobacteria bacterium]|nr:type II secretion system protein [Alphaproteobacteria bacterium]
MHGLKRKSSGFTLVELSIMLTIIGVIAATIMLEMVTGATVNAERVTLSRMQAIEQAITSRYKVFNAIPCPAPMTFGINATEFGRSVPDNIVVSGAANCGTAPGVATSFANTNATTRRQKVVMGSVPTKNLGLPDEYAFDGWGRRIAYFMHFDYGTDQSHPMPTDFDNTTIIPIYDHHNAGTRQIIARVPAVLISYGKSGNGATPPNGAALANRIRSLTANSFEDRNITITAGTPQALVRKAFVPDSPVANDRFDQIVQPIDLHNLQ